MPAVVVPLRGGATACTAVYVLVLSKSVLAGAALPALAGVATLLAAASLLREGAAARPAVPIVFVLYMFLAVLAAALALRVHTGRLPLPAAAAVLMIFC